MLRQESNWSATVLNVGEDEKMLTLMQDLRVAPARAVWPGAGLGILLQSAEGIDKCRSEDLLRSSEFGAECR